MQQLNLHAQLAMLGASALHRALEAAPSQRRQILVDEGASPHVVSGFTNLLLAEQEVFLMQVLRTLRDARRPAAPDFRRTWSELTGTEDLGEGRQGDLRQEPGTGAIDFSRIPIRRPKKFGSAS